ncbi:histone deacetylase family protein [Polycladidibacter hongkongensis]|uniref:histone deacetylase family protein n=1 Tax=Polycladidibacter hongkongensis TaxID=1647556 RepID=UPI00082A1322|nr:histone deacetylase family protein [Pseudovibrio hongkongensis]
MQTIFSQLQLGHDPAHEISDGQLRPANEVPQRAKTVLQAVKQRALGPICEPQEFSLEPILRVHDAAYVEFLEDAWQQCLQEGRAEAEAFPFVWPVGRLRRDVVPDHLDGKLGFYSFDAGTPIGANTWAAAKASAFTALSGAKLLHDGASSAFALCRPPGHHAHRDMFGGYCFLNNAAIAAQYLRDHGAARVSVLDIDYHHGNGTQDIFYERADVQFISLHADPKQEFPYFLGHANEQGVCKGVGYNHNLPLPHGTEWPQWQEALEVALQRLQEFRPDALIVSLGMDTYEHDPISQFRLQSEHFLQIGAMLRQQQLPTLFVMEGGYAVDVLGENCLNVLQSFEQA